MVNWELDVIYQKFVNQTVLMKDFPVIIRDLQDYHTLTSFRIVKLNGQL